MGTPKGLALWVTDKVNKILAMFREIPGRSFPLPLGESKERAMQQGRTPAAGGFFLFLGPVLGAIYGAGRGEPIAWMLVGFGVGVALAVMIWLIDRRR